jgi:adenylate cyclase
MRLIPAKRLADQVAELPPIVRDRLAREQDKSERLIGWIQLAIVCTFGLLYFTSRSTAPMATHIWLVTPLAIGLYFVFTVIRLVMAYRVRLGFWLLAGSIVIDMSLLYSLIWSFHLQYAQPPSFYLKAPTLLYVFIFIALRALRFEARYVVMSGIAAAVGWLALILYVIVSDPANAMITRSYVAYLTSNSVLIGGEIDKIISILVVTTILALAVRQARIRLIEAVTGKQASENLSRFFAPEIASQISRDGHELMAGAGQSCEAAILNLDVRNFTKLAATSTPQEVMGVLADYQRQMVPIIQRHGGSIDKFLGDGIMATFGATRPQEDYAARALAALEECMQVAAAWVEEQERDGRPPLAVNGAVASGRIIAGAVGDATRLEYTVIGDAVNLSAKLEKQNKVIGCRALVLKETYDAALAQGYRPQSEHRSLARVNVIGVAVPVDLVAVA